MPSADRAALDRFATTPEGRELIDEWGERAPRCVAALTARWERVMSRLSGDALDSFNHFIDNITGAEFKAIANHLTRWT